MTVQQSERDQIAAYIEAQADKRRGALRLGFRVLASNIRAGLHEVEERDRSDG